MTGSVVVLSGGVGGAKLALGLYRVLPPQQLALILNTGDDFEHLGLKICPDIDTALYTLGGLANTEQGWGRADESWQCLGALSELGGEDWFRLGDKDLALHLVRQQLLGQGLSLCDLTQQLAVRLGINAALIPMSNETVATKVHTNEGILAFQQYFVRRQCQPTVEHIVFSGAANAAIAPAAITALTAPDLAAIIIAPSNPYLSIAPMLALPTMRDILAASPAPVIAVSPVIGGKAVKGPTVKIMAELGLSPSADAVAHSYADFLDGFVLDTCDAKLARSLPFPTYVTNTLMNSLEDRDQLARDTLAFAAELRR